MKAWVQLLFSYVIAIKSVLCSVFILEWNSLFDADLFFPFPFFFCCLLMNYLQCNIDEEKQGEEKAFHLLLSLDLAVRVFTRTEKLHCCGNLQAIPLREINPVLCCLMWWFDVQWHGELCKDTQTGLHANVWGSVWGMRGRYMEHALH